MRTIFLSVLTAVSFLVLSSCTVWKFDNLLTERNRDDIPKIAGTYVDSNKQSIRIRTTEFSNTFTVTPPDGKAPVRVTLEMIEPKRFLVQGRLEGQTAGLPEYLITVAEIDGRTITVYFFPGLEEKIDALAKENRIKVELIGFKQSPDNQDVEAALNILTEYESVDDLINFFQALFTMEGSQRLVFTKR
jgi:hypothetical protein